MISDIQTNKNLDQKNVTESKNDISIANNKDAKTPKNYAKKPNSHVNCMNSILKRTNLFNSTNNNCKNQKVQDKNCYENLNSNKSSNILKDYAFSSENILQLKSNKIIPKSANSTKKDDSMSTNECLKSVKKLVNYKKSNISDRSLEINFGKMIENVSRPKLKDITILNNNRQNVNQKSKNGEKSEISTSKIIYQKPGRSNSPSSPINKRNHKVEKENSTDFSIYNDRMLIKRIEEGHFSGPCQQISILKENNQNMSNRLISKSTTKKIDSKHNNSNYTSNITIKKRHKKIEKENSNIDISSSNRNTKKIIENGLNFIKKAPLASNTSLDFISSQNTSINTNQQKQIWLNPNLLEKISENSAKGSMTDSQRLKMFWTLPKDDLSVPRKIKMNYTNSPLIKSPQLIKQSPKRKVSNITCVSQASVSKSPEIKKNRIHVSISRKDKSVESELLAIVSSIGKDSIKNKFSNNFRNNTPKTQESQDNPAKTNFGNIVNKFNQYFNNKTKRQKVLSSNSNELKERLCDNEFAFNSTTKNELSLKKEMTNTIDFKKSIRSSRLDRREVSFADLNCIENDSFGNPRNPFDKENSQTDSVNKDFDEISEDFKSFENYFEINMNKHFCMNKKENLMKNNVKKYEEFKKDIHGVRPGRVNEFSNEFANFGITYN